MSQVFRPESTITPSPRMPWSKGVGVNTTSRLCTGRFRTAVGMEGHDFGCPRAVILRKLRRSMMLSVVVATLGKAEESLCCSIITCLVGLRRSLVSCETVGTTTMSDTEKPTEQTPPPAEQQPTAKPPREKPPQPSGKVPSLQHEQAYGFGKKIDAFDEEMERQLQEAMSGMSDKDLYGEPARPSPRVKPAADAGAKKGKVFRIHGQDVFIDLP